MRQPLGERVRDSLRLRGLDLKDRLGGKADRLVPPRRLDFVGHSDFVETGDEFLGHFVELGGLKPHHAVLDVGCGIGPDGPPAAGYLEPAAPTTGSTSTATASAGAGALRAPTNFRFQVADLYNRRYNPRGAHARPTTASRTTTALRLRDPHSVLTHLLEARPSTTSPRSRACCAGGARLATFFLLNDESRGCIARAVGARVPRPDDHCRVVDADLPEEAVAYDEAGCASARTPAARVAPRLVVRP
jgi:hypothetical protein